MVSDLLSINRYICPSIISIIEHMEKKEQEKQVQPLSEAELEQVNGGMDSTMCPICGHRITEPLKVHKQKYHK